MKSTHTFTRGLARFAGNVARSVLDITHDSFALLGLAVMFAIFTLTARPEIRQAGEIQLMSWLQTRQPAAASPSTDTDPPERDVTPSIRPQPRQQLALTRWLGKKYNIAPEPMGALVEEVFEAGRRAKIDPTLILAIMAIESGFNPYAQSAVGAQGLMQVMTKIHSDKYEDFGGKLAAFDPVANLQVGIKVLQECISRGGSVEAGLRLYVGAGSSEDGGYAAKVLAEHNRLQLVFNGRVAPVVPAAASVASHMDIPGEGIDMGDVVLEKLTSPQT